MKGMLEQENNLGAETATGTMPLSENQIEGLKGRFRNHGRYMSHAQITALARQNKGKIFHGYFVEDLTEQALLVAEAFKSTLGEVELFDQHWGFIEKLNEELIANIVVPHLRVELTDGFGKLQAEHDRLRLVEHAMAYERCIARLFLLSSNCQANDLGQE